MYILCVYACVGMEPASRQTCRAHKICINLHLVFTITVFFLLDRNLVTCLSVSMDGTLLLSGSNDETVRMWDVQSKQCIWSINHKGKQQAVFLSLSLSLISLSTGNICSYVQSPFNHPSILQCSVRLADSSVLPGSLTSLLLAHSKLTCH